MRKLARVGLDTGIRGYTESLAGNRHSRLLLAYRIYREVKNVTRKDYIAIATVLHERYIEFREILGGRFVVEVCAGSIADVFAADNERFNKEKFMDAVRKGIEP